jgi:23S rRNA (pseudouridine1915-N3)-methyltransferase
MVSGARHWGGVRLNSAVPRWRMGWVVRGRPGRIPYAPSMQLTLAHIGGAAKAQDPFDGLTRMYMERCAGYVRCDTEVFRTEQAFLEWMERRAGRTPAVAVLLDSRGRTMSSEALAAWVGGRRDQGAQHLVFAIGPASGWSDEGRARAQLLLSLGPMTLAHALARVVLAEQIYRAFTILAGHPYHCGH